MMHSQLPNQCRRDGRHQLMAQQHKSSVLSQNHYAPSFEAESDEEVYDVNKEGLVRSMLSEIGEDPEREGLKRTPLRVAKALDFLTSGYELSAEDIIKGAVFHEDVKEMVVVRDIEFYSLYRSLNAYKNTFSSKSDILVIEPKSEFFKYFK